MFRSGLFSKSLLPSGAKTCSQNMPFKLRKHQKRTQSCPNPFLYPNPPNRAQPNPSLALRGLSADEDQRGRWMIKISQSGPHKHKPSQEKQLLVKTRHSQHPRNLRQRKKCPEIRAHLPGQALRSKNGMSRKLAVMMAKDLSKANKLRLHRNRRTFRRIFGIPRSRRRQDCPKKQP